jgi:hypothetical protein
MATDCCNSFGGRISIEIGGKRYPARGDITINPTNVEVAAEANHDGSPYFTSRPVLYGAQMTFTQPCGLSWDAELARCALNVTIIEETNGRAHLFTGARIIGRPVLNISTGEVSGLSIMTDRYQQVAA